MGWKDNFLSGHISIGRLTIHGRNAMHWGVIFYTKKYGYICFRLPFTYHGKWYPLYLYFSPNATPSAATFMLGKKHSPEDWVKSRVRYACFGHNYDVHGWNERYQCENYHILQGIRNMIGNTPFVYAEYAKENGYVDKD